MTARLLKQTAAFTDQEWSAAQVTEQSCQIGGTPDFYRPRRVGLKYIERFTPLLEQQLAAAGNSLAKLLNAAFK